MIEEARIKRLRIRSWRRGMREMDLILGPFADARLAGMDEEMIQRYEALLEVDDQTLFGVFGGQGPAPDGLETMIAELRTFHDLRER